MPLSFKLIRLRIHFKQLRSLTLIILVSDAKYFPTNPPPSIQIFHTIVDQKRKNFRWKVKAIKNIDIVVQISAASAVIRTPDITTAHLN
jgi:hypothetical protein